MNPIRTRSHFLQILLTLFLCFSGALAHAQTTAFNYQGRLSDGGNPPSGLYDLQFRLFDAASSGNQVGMTILRDDVTVVGGVFSVSVDFGAAAFPGADRWLEIDVRPGASTGTFTTLNPRQAIDATPYALQSLNAANALQLAGVASDQYVLTTDPRLSDARAPTAGSAHYIHNTASLQSGSNFNITGNGTIGGNLNLPNTSGATTGILTLGGNRFLHNFGTENMFVGRNAGNLTMSGYSNTATGDRAFLSNTTGYWNTSNGTVALYSNTTGNSNAATGTAALYSNTTGNSNTATGTGTMYNNTGGSSNTATGTSALFSNTSGSYNTATGAGALFTSTTSGYNTATGFQALYFNTTGENNTALGANALTANTTGYQNTSVGSEALPFNTTGIWNVAIGSEALYSNTTGNTNTAIGYQALYSNKPNTEPASQAHNNIAIGWRALYSNTTGNTNIAIGTNALLGLTTGGGNVAIGADTLGPGLGNHNTMIGNSAGNWGSSQGSYENTFVGYQAALEINLPAGIHNATAIGAHATVDASNKIRLGNQEITVLESQVGLTAVSDRNAKENLRPVDADDVLRKLAGMEVMSWNYIGHDPADFRHYGPVAQDFFAAFGNDGVGKVGSPTTINTTDMAGILMLAVQALERRTAALQNANEALRSENEALEDRLRRLEQSLHIEP
jgi:hypothetical protein